MIVLLLHFYGYLQIPNEETHRRFVKLSHYAVVRQAK